MNRAESTIPVVRISVAVDDRSRFERRGEPVAIGVSFPRGEVPPTTAWSLLKEGGSPAPVQTTVLERWADQSVRWMLLEFQADADVDQRSHYWLVNRPFEVQRPLSVTTGPSDLLIDSGAAQFRVPLSGHVAIADAIGGNRSALADLTVVAEDTGGRTYRLAVRRTSIAQAGPLTATILHEGDLVGADGSPWLESTVRLQFHAGLGVVRVEVSCTNPRAAQHPDGIWDLGDPGSVLIRHLSVTMRPSAQGPGTVVASLDRAGQLQAAGDRFEVYQDSSGGANWQSANHLNRNDKVPTVFRGYRAVLGGQPVEGLRGTPIASLNGGEGRITIAMSRFWEVFPKALIVEREQCTIGILPDQTSDAHELQAGERTTFEFTLGIGEDHVSQEPLAWARSPLTVTIDPDAYRRAGCWAPLAVGSPVTQRWYEDLVRGAVNGDSPFRDRREVIDEYGWRNFGEIYADHEAVRQPGLISHYNNQYDAIAGMGTRYMATADPRWFSAMRELADHVTDIDLYHTTGDRAAYNGGYFWHTQHYVPAGMATHRSYSRLAVSSGGGPSAEHNYTSGLLLHYFLTGSRRSHDAVLQLANWAVDMDDGRKSRFRWIDSGPTGLASGTRSVDFHGPGRGAGNSINALVDAHRLTGQQRYLDKADALVRRCIHPDDDPEALGLRDVENRWSYTVFLQVLGKYLEYRSERGLHDAMFAYGREALIRYAEWMSANERPSLDSAGQLEFPTETWAAQDIRKAAVFEWAAYYAPDEAARISFLVQAAKFFDYATGYLVQSPTGQLTRPIVLLLAYRFQRPTEITTRSAEASLTRTSIPRVRFVPQRRRIVWRVGLIGAGLSLLGLIAIGMWAL